MGRLPFFPSRRQAPVEQPIPSQRIARASQGNRRRLDDAVGDAFQRACLNNDLEIAEVLLGVLETLHQRRVDRFGIGRPINDEAITRARLDLAQRRQGWRTPTES